MKYTYYITEKSLTLDIICMWRWDGEHMEISTDKPNDWSLSECKPDYFSAADKLTKREAKRLMPNATIL